MIKFILAPVFFISAFLTSCSYAPHIVIFNHLKNDISIYYVDRSEFVVPDSYATVYYLPKNREQTLTVTSKNCHYFYNIDIDSDELRKIYKIEELSDYAYEELKFQIDEDFNIYIIPKNSYPLSLEEAIKFQKGGFPIQPTNKECT